MSVFSEILIRSGFTAGIAAMIAMILRTFLRNCPRKWSYILWAAVFFRCLCPISFESSLSIFNLFLAEENVGYADMFVNYAEDNTDNTKDPVYAYEYTLNEQTAAETVTAENNAEIPVTADPIFIIWTAGAAAMLIYGAVSYFLLMKKVGTAIKTDNNVFETPRINSAFTAVSLPPKIYIPAGLDGMEKQLIIAHECAHIRRLDPYAKLLAYIGMSLHWFDPLIWISFALMTRDMELSCDECVLSGLDNDGRRAYSTALLNASVKQSGIYFPPAFAEKIVSKRIKNALSYKKPAPVVSIFAAAAVFMTVGLIATDAVTPAETQAEEISRIEVTEMLPAAVTVEEYIPYSEFLISDSDGDKIYFSCVPDHAVNNIFKFVNGAETLDPGKWSDISLNVNKIVYSCPSGSMTVYRLAEITADAIADGGEFALDVSAADSGSNAEMISVSDATVGSIAVEGSDDTAIKYCETKISERK